MHAALALGELQAQEATPELVTSLDDPDENVRFHAIEALGRIGAAESIAPLAKIAASDNFFLAFAAIDALSKTDDARVAPLMVSLLDQELLRPAAIATLAAIGDEDCVPALARALNEPDSEAGPIAERARRDPRRYEDDLGAGSFIVEATQNARHRARPRPAGRPRSPRDDADRRARRDGPRLAGPRRARSAAGARRRGRLVRRRSTTASSPIGADAVSPLIASARLVVALGADRRPPRLLGRIGDRRAMPPLLRALDDSEADAAAAAAAALGNLGDPAALDGLIELFGHPSATVRRAAIAAVNSIGARAPPRAASACHGRRPIPRVRESALRVAGYFGFADSVPAIVAALGDPVEDVRRAAIEQLPVLDDVDAAAQLRPRSPSETPRNRAAAAHALRQLDDPRAGAALQARAAGRRCLGAVLRRASRSATRSSATVTPTRSRTLARRDPATHVRIAAITALAPSTGDWRRRSPPS